MTEIVKSYFGTTAAGEEVYRYTMSNGRGMAVSVISYAGCVQSVIVPDRDGRPTDVVLGYDTVADYENGTSFFGAFVGRYANRIGGSAFTLNGVEYHLPMNEGRNHLHGTYAHRVFPMEVTDGAVVLHGVSPDGEEGYPGNLNFDVTYRLTEDNALAISYSARSDRDTVINLTNHAYFNLNGQDGSTILDHSFMLKASCFTETDAESIPTGKNLPVENTPMDFRRAKKVGAEIHTDFEQTTLCRGYDHNFVLDTTGAGEEYAVLTGDRTGIVMHCFTDQPGVQFYAGNFLDNAVGKGGTVYPTHGGMCLETQHYPDSPNNPQFPSTVLRAGEEYSSETVYQFEIS